MTVVNSVSRRSLAGSFPKSVAHICTSILLLAAANGAAQQPSVSAYRDPAELVQQAVQNEIKAANDDRTRFLFRGTKTTPRGRRPDSMWRPGMLPPVW